MLKVTFNDYVQRAADRIAGTALGPFIMGERHVDLNALEARIVKQVRDEAEAMSVSYLLVMGRENANRMFDAYDKAKLKMEVFNGKD